MAFEADRTLWTGGVKSPGRKNTPAEAASVRKAAGSSVPADRGAARWACPASAVSGPEPEILVVTWLVRWAFSSHSVLPGVRALCRFQSPADLSVICC